MYFLLFILRRIPARTNALGYMVSRLPRGICNTKAEVVGMTVTSLVPRSILLHLSSASGVSGGISRSGDTFSSCLVFYHRTTYLKQEQDVRISVDAVWRCISNELELAERRYNL